MKQFKKATAILLALCLILSVWTVAPTFAAEQSGNPVGASSGTTGDCTWTLDDEGTLTISGKGNMENYETKSNWDDLDITTAPWGIEIKKVIIKSGVSNVGEAAFCGCQITSVEIPESVITINDSGFKLCRELTELIIPEGVKEIESDAFWYCDNIKYVTIPASTTHIGWGAFECCFGLSDVYYSGSEEQWNEIYISNENDNLLSANIHYSDSIPENEGIGSGTTGECIWTLDSAGTLTISGDGMMKDYQLDRDDDGNLITDAPWGTGIKKVIIENGVKNVGNKAFGGCSSLESVDIGNDVKTIGQCAFTECTSLTNISIPDSVTNLKESSFGSCKSLKSVDFGDGVDTIGKGAFSNCISLLKIKTGNNVKKIDEDAFMFCDNLTDVFIQSATRIEMYAFSHNHNLENVTLPENLQYIGHAAFWDTEMKSIRIPKSVTTIEDIAFGYVGNKLPEKAGGYVICGFSNTEAERYANDNQITFVSLDEEDVPITEPTNPTEPTEPNTDEPIEEIALGDLSGDGKVDAKDRIMLTRYLAHWAGYETIDEQAADLNKDGKVDAKDRIILTRHLAKWQGYETL